MRLRLYGTLRDLHLYVGLFISPFVLAFAISVFFLVHAWLPKPGPARTTRVVSDLPLPGDLKSLSGRPLIDAIRPALDWAGVRGEVGWVQNNVSENRLVLPVTVPGRLTTVTIDVTKREASVREQPTGLADALVVLHKLPGPHLVGLRMNWLFIRIWSWFADATVYGLLLVSVSGLYLWYALKAERMAGACILAVGAILFVTLVYALCH